MGGNRVGCGALVGVLGLALGLPSARAQSQPVDTVRLSIEVSDVAKTGAMLDDDSVVLSIPALRTIVAEVPRRDVAVVSEALMDRGATRVQIDPPVHAAARVPNDPLWPQQWGPTRVAASLAWDRTTGSPSTVVAVLDTGVDASHPDLADALAVGTDLVNGDDDASDDHGHGTAVAGIIGARGDNAVGIAGYCWRCTILPVKVLDDLGSGDSSTVAAGIVWAVDHGASVVNLSLSSPSSSFPLSSAITYAEDHDVVVVAAAGNDGLLQPSYPAAYPSVIGVVATDRLDHLYPWSNRGRWAKVAAPGCHTTIERGGGYAELCGTSSASPAVAGIVALERSVSPSASAAKVVASLLTSASPIEAGPTGSGRVDAERAVVTVLHEDAPPPPATDVAGAPGPPRGLRVTTDESAAVLTWMAPTEVGESAIVEYVVSVSPGGTTHVVSAEATSITVGGLINGLTYRFTVAARSARGLGPAIRSLPVTPSSDGLARVAGAGRVLTAVALSQRAFATAEVVVVARADDYADALAAAPFAARLGGPLLLSRSSDEVEPALGGEIQRLGAHVVHLIGGPGALSPALELSLEKWGVTNVVRTAGRNRFDTARLIALQVGGRSVYVANGVTGWPDAVAGSGLAAVQGRPILLVASDRVPDETRAALRQLDAESAIVIGGTGSVSSSLLAVLMDPDDDGVSDVSVSRIAGADRYDTSRLVADVAVSAGADPSRAWLASGTSWPDALATGPAVAARGGVLLLIDGGDLGGSPAVAAWLTQHAPSLEEVVLVGGGASINGHAEEQVRQVQLSRL